MVTRWKKLINTRMHIFTTKLEVFSTCIDDLVYVHMGRFLKMMHLNLLSLYLSLFSNICLAHFGFGSEDPLPCASSATTSD